MVTHDQACEFNMSTLLTKEWEIKIEKEKSGILLISAGMSLFLSLPVSLDLFLMQLKNL